MIKGGLIGYPVAPSISDKVYPLLFSKINIFCSIHKINIIPSCLEDFFSAYIEYDFINVTMPHKDSVLQYCDEVSEDAKIIGSVNFIRNNDGHLIGYNFDGIAALDSIEAITSVKNKKILIIGTGSAGKATIYEARKRGACVSCANRTITTGKNVASYFNVPFYEHPTASSFDILINATNIGMNKDDRRMIIKNQKHLKDKIILDMASRTGCCLLKNETAYSNNKYISGGIMFFHLAETCIKHVITPTELEI